MHIIGRDLIATNPKDIPWEILALKNVTESKRKQPHLKNNVKILETL